MAEPAGAVAPAAARVAGRGPDASSGTLLLDGVGVREAWAYQGGV